MNKQKHRDKTALTPRELEVQTLTSQGLSLQEIAEKLGIALETVRGYQKSAKIRQEARKTQR